MAAKECSATVKALQQIEERVTCAICLEPCTQAKLLKCFHVYCMKCVQPLAREGPDGQSVTCPHCRQTTVLPHNGVLGLQGAFYIEHFLEIQDTLQTVNSSENDKAQCQKCEKREATSFCHSCGFLCQRCREIHQEWKDFSSHEVISLATLTEDVTAMVPPLKKTVFCSKHSEKEADLYCDTCDELICRDCIVKDHTTHCYDFVEKSFSGHEAVIESGLKSVEEQLATLSKARKDVCTRRASLLEQRKAMEADICGDIDHLKQVLETRRLELLGEVQNLFEPKLAGLENQEKEIEAREEQLRNCSGCVRESLRTGSQKKILSIKKPVVEEMAELTGSLRADLLVPNEQADIHYRCSDPSIARECQKLGKVHVLVVHPEQCVASGLGVKAAVVGEVSSVCVQTVDWDGMAMKKAVEDLQIVGELVSSDGQDHVRAGAKKKTDEVYELAYQPQHRGQHQLHIAVEGQAIMNSPFTVTVLPNLTTPTSIIEGLCRPRGVAIGEEGDMVVAEAGAHCITTISCSGEKKSFGTRGSLAGQLNNPESVAMDRDGNIMVADSGNHRIQKFSFSGRCIKAVGSRGKGHLQFKRPTGIAIHPHTHKIYVVDRDNCRVQILNSNLTLHGTFGKRGSSNGEFILPHGIAIDRDGNVYVADEWRSNVQVFSPDGVYINQFGKGGEGEEKLSYPAGIAIDSNNLIYITEWSKNCMSIFTSSGEFIHNSGRISQLRALKKMFVDQPQFFQPIGIAVNKNGTIYVCDTGNNRVKII